jgi:hypothetical protein
MPAGVYAVTVLDSNGCEIRGDTLIIQPPPLSIAVLDVVDNICFGASEGAITTQAMGGVPRSGAMLAALGFALDRDFTRHALPGQTAGFIDQYWQTGGLNDWWMLATLGNYYSMFQISKGMRSFNPPLVHIGASGRDWYREISTWLLANQDINGAFQNDTMWVGGYPGTRHSLGLLVLIPTVFETPPVAVAQAGTPTPPTAGPRSRWCTASTTPRPAASARAICSQVRPNQAPL